MQDEYTFAEASFLINQALLFEERHPLTDSNQEGLAYDRDVWALYGDPAYEARLPRVTEPLYEQSLERLPIEKPGQVRLKLTMTLNRAAHLGKPVIWRLPVRLLDARLVSGPGEVEVADDLVLARFSQPGEPELPAGSRIELVVEGLEVPEHATGALVCPPAGYQGLVANPPQGDRDGRNCHCCARSIEERLSAWSLSACLGDRFTAPILCYRWYRSFWKTTGLRSTPPGAR